MLLNSWKNQFQYNIFSTASCTASGATCLFNAHGGTMGFWFLSKLLECVFHNTLTEFSVNAEKSVVSSVLLSTMRTIQDAQSTLLPTMLYTHNCTGIISTLWRDRLKHKEKKKKKKGGGGGVRMWKDVLSFQSPNEITPEVHSLWGCTALQGLMPSSEKGVEWKKS